MLLEKGNIEQPTGNLILYCDVIGENPLDLDSKIIASNVFVSFLNHDNNLPAITFPPVPFKNGDEFERFLTMQKSFDLMRLQDFQFPPDAEKAQEYVNQRLQEVNDLVKQYVEHCASYLKAYVEKVPLKPSEKSDVIDQLNYLEKLSNRLRKNFDESLFSNLTDFWRNFVDRNPQYPLHNLLQHIQGQGPSADKLVNLFFAQSRAIYYEQYEEADQLQSEISRLTDQG